MTEVKLLSGRVTDYQVKVLTLGGVEDHSFETQEQAREYRKRQRQHGGHLIATARLFTALVETLHPPADQQP